MKIEGRRRKRRIKRRREKRKRREEEEEEVTSKLVGRDGKVKRVTTGRVGMAGILKIYCTEFSNI